MIVELLGLALGAAPLGADRNDPAAPVAINEVIVVTGERVPRTLRDTASSVTVFTRNSIEGTAADRVEQLLALSPNVQLGSSSDGPTIRGQDSTGVLHDLPAFLGGNRPRVTLQVDGRAVGYNEFTFGAAPLWDVDRVEVFRSPQTTTQGRNSIGGAIFIETEDPAPAWEGRVRAIGGEFATRQYSGMLNAPLVGDQVAVRIAGDLRSSRTASRIGQNTNGGPDPNDDDYGQMRVKLLARPTGLPGARIELTYAHNQSHMPQVEGNVLPFRRRRDPDATYGVFRINVDSLTGRLSYRASPALNFESTISVGDAAVRRFAPRGLGETRVQTRDVSAEGIAHWTPERRFELLVGMHGLRATLDQSIDVSATPLGRGKFDDVQQSFGLFGEARWHPAERLTITGGARYQHDRQDRTGGLTSRFRTIGLDYHHSFHAWLPKVAVSYDLAREVSVGALIQRAYNPGGTTINLRTGGPDAYDAETLWDYELYARTAAPAAGLTGSINLFYYAMTNAQRPQERLLPNPGGPPVGFVEIDNAPRARTYGLEAEVGWRATDRLTLRGAIGLLNTRITRTLAAADPLLRQPFQRSPAITAAAAVDWRPLQPLRITAQLRHNSGYFSDDTGNRGLRVSGSATLDARAAWDFERFSLFASARNLTDEFHLTLLGEDAPGLRNFATVGDPRKLAVGVEARF
ncbi:MAG: TonB-dependent receptor [Sphingomicrobium sp.]